MTHDDGGDDVAMGDNEDGDEDGDDEKAGGDEYNDGEIPE